MSTFLYTGLDTASAYVKGRVEAKNQKKALAQLEGEGFMIVNIKEEKTKRFGKINSIFDSVTRLDKIFFTRHLFTMLESGIALDHAVKITAEQINNQKFKAVLEDIHARLRQGQTFYSALGQHPRFFSNFFINLVKVGEKSGKLEEVLFYLLEQQESDYELLTKSRGAMIYPSIIITALLVMVTFMMVFVVPKVTGVLTQYDVDLPIATKVLIAISKFLISYGIFLIPVIALLAFAFRKWIKTNKGKHVWHSFLLKIPRLNKMIVEFNLARLARSMSALLKSGVSFDEAMELAASVSNNVMFQDSLRVGIPFIQKGVGFSEVLKGYPKLYPPITTRMVEVGERSGKLDHMLSRLATFYEKSVTTSIGNLASVIEPVLLLCIGFAVAFVAIAVLTPIWKFSETI